MLQKHVVNNTACQKVLKCELEKHQDTPYEDHHFEAVYQLQHLHCKQERHEAQVRASKSIKSALQLLWCSKRRISGKKQHMTSEEISLLLFP